MGRRQCSAGVLRDHGGEITGLARFLSEHWDAVEADFQHHYGMDLRRVLWVERVGCRRLLALLQWLPVSSPTSALLRSQSEAEPEKKKPNGGWARLARRMTGAASG